MLQQVRNNTAKAVSVVRTKVAQAVAVGGVTMMTAASAFAEDDPGIKAITDLGGKATSYISAAFGVAVLVAGGFWGISMMRKAFKQGK